MSEDFLQACSRFSAGRGHGSRPCFQTPVAKGFFGQGQKQVRNCGACRSEGHLRTALPISVVLDRKFCLQDRTLAFRCNDRRMKRGHNPRLFHNSLKTWSCEHVFIRNARNAVVATRAFRGITAATDIYLGLRSGPLQNIFATRHHWQQHRLGISALYLCRYGNATAFCIGDRPRKKLQGAGNERAAAL